MIANSLWIRCPSNTSTGKNTNKYNKYIVQYIAIHTKLDSCEYFGGRTPAMPRLGAPQRPLWRGSASSPRRSTSARERAHHKRRTNGPELHCSNTSSGRVAEVSPETDAIFFWKTSNFQGFGKTGNVSCCKKLNRKIFFPTFI